MLGMFLVLVCLVLAVFLVLGMYVSSAWVVSSVLIPPVSEYHR